MAGLRPSHVLWPVSDRATPPTGGLPSVPETFGPRRGARVVAGLRPSHTADRRSPERAGDLRSPLRRGRETRAEHGIGRPRPTCGLRELKGCVVHHSTVRALLLLAVLFGVGRAAEKQQSGTPTPNPKVSSEEISHWLRRAEGHFLKLSDNDRSDVATLLCGLYSDLDEVPRFTALISQIQDPEKRASATFMLAITLAASEKTDAAIRLAQTLDNRRTPNPETGISSVNRRDRALSMVSRAQSASHDFAGAKGTIRRIGSPEIVSSAWRTVAENQAKAGLYEEALVSLGKVVVTSDDYRKAKEESRQTHRRMQSEGT